MKKLLLFAATLLCAASMLAQHEGPWWPIESNEMYCSKKSNPSIAFNQLDRSFWADEQYWVWDSWISDYHDEDGFGFEVDGHAYGGNKKQAGFRLCKWEATAPSYSFMKLTWKYQLRSRSTKCYSCVSLYLNKNLTLDEFKNLQVDFSEKHSSKAGSEYLLAYFNNDEKNEKHRKSGVKTKNFEVDNISGTEEKSNTWYLMMTYVLGNGSDSKSGLFECGLFKSLSVDTTWVYRSIITFDANGGNGTMDGLTMDGSAKLPANAFSRDGYIFAGWATSAGGPAVYAEQEVITIAESFRGPQTLYAVWTKWGEGKKEGPWTQLERNTHVCANDGPTTSMTFAGMNGEPWAGTVSDREDKYGIGYNYAGKSSKLSVLGVFSTYMYETVVPEYTRMILNWKYELCSKTTKHHSNVCLYALPKYDNLKNLKVDFSNQYIDHSGSKYLLSNYKNDKQDGKVHVSSQKTASLAFDNIGSSTEQTKAYYMLMTYVMGSADGKSGLNECGSFRSVSVDTTWVYRTIITFNANGGSGEMANQTIDGSGTLSANIFTRDGYIFAGWSQSPDGKVVYTDQSAITVSASDKGPVTYYAKWVEGTGSAEQATEGIWTQLEWRTLACGKSTKSVAFSSMDNSTWENVEVNGWHDGDGIGFTFKGNSQYDSKQGVFSTYKNDVVVPSYTSMKQTWKYKLSSRSKKHRSTTSLYGIQGTYDEITSLVVDFSNDEAGDAGKQQRLATFTNGDQDDLVKSTDEQTYMIEVDNLSSSSQQAQTRYLLLTHVIASGDPKEGLHEWGAFKSLSAETEWVYRKIVSLDKNGGSGTMDEIVIDNSGTLPANTFTRDRFEFMGWALSPDGEVVYADGAEITATAEDKGPVTLYAVWQRTAYAITYELDGGTADNPDSYAVNTALAIKDPTKANYTFVGWTGSNGIVPQKNISIIKGMAGDQEYTAHWINSRVDSVINLIDAIGQIEYTEECNARIDTASEAYGALDEDEQALVSNIRTLIIADEFYQTAKENKIGNTTLQFVRDDEVVGRQKVELEYSLAPDIQGYIFQYWQVKEKNISDGIIRLQAVYAEDPASDIEEINANAKANASKFIRNGNLYILKDEFIYTVNGQRVK